MIQTDFNVTDLAGLNAALRAIDIGGSMAGTNTAYTITLPPGTLTLDRELLAINLAAGSSLTLRGNGGTLDGGGVHRGLMVLSGTVDVVGLTIAHMRAVGGAGGDGLFGGGGGAGLGGGLFVGSAGVVTLTGVVFADNTAAGGAGGASTGTGGGGGGGMGGAGGDGSGPAELNYGGLTPTGLGGGGGLGVSAVGGDYPTQQNGGSGIAAGGDAGGRGSDYQAGGVDGGGGGGGRLANFLTTAGGGGIAGHDASNYNHARGWGVGGFGGGGGATLGTYGGGNGGFGGGSGGSMGYGALGGFGGGSGGAVIAPGNDPRFGFGGGLGGVAGDAAAGGGGLGAGGAIFVQRGGNLLVLGGDIAGGQVAGGAGGTGDAAGGDGQGLGSGIFLHGGQTITLAALPGGTLTVADVITEETATRYSGGHAGLIIAAGGTVALTAANNFSGGVLLQNHATLRLGHELAAGSGAITFAAGGDNHLVIDGLAAPTGVLTGVSVGTSLTLRAIASAGASFAIERGNVLLVADGLHSIRLRLDPRLDLADATPVLSDDGSGGTRVSFAAFPEFGVACFRHGTAIATPRGAVAVEHLRIGDRVMAGMRQGGQSQMRQVRWIGRRSATSAELAAQPELRPVLVRRGALGDGNPARDLFVSPLHALLVGGVLVPAVNLVNGHSIIRTPPTGGIEYCHIELDDQALVLAEGALAETFLDMGSRAMFDNAASFATLDWVPRNTPDALAVERVESGFRLETIRRQLANRAGLGFHEPAPGTLRFNVERIDATSIEGWAMDESCADRPVELEVRQGMRVVARLLANRYRADLDRADLSQGRCAFLYPIPPDVSAPSLSLHRTADGMRL